MGADKTNNIMTLSSGVSQPLLADVQYFELYSSSALNRKLKNIVLPGFYCGFEPVPGTGLSVRITSENSEGKGAASVDVNNVQISVQQIEDVTVLVKAGATNIIVLEANFEHGVKTTQVDSASSVSAARIYARTDNTIGQNQIELCRVIVPSGATAVTKEMIVLKYRVNRAVGVEFSNEISSTEERKAATPLAVKTLHDLVDTKAPLDSPHLSGTPTSPTPEPGTNNTQIANAAFVYAAINALINGAPGTMDTLKEIAAAINNDPKFSETINNALALKAPLASPALTGVPTAPTAAQGTNNTQIATTAYVRAAISALVGSSPEALDTLNELAAALGNDPNFATTMTNALAGKQPLDATLTALAGLATGANKLPYFTGTDTVSQTDLTSVGRDILAKTSVLAVIQYLGLEETINRAADALQKSQNGADIPDKPRFVQNIGLKETLNPTKRVSIGNIGTGVFDGSTPCINIGDSDSGFIGSADGVLDIYCNAAKVGYIDGNGLHMLTDIHFDNARMTTNGDIFGSVWGNNWLSIWITNQLNTRGTIDWINSELAVRDNNINTRATWDYVNQTFARKNTGSIQDWGWILDDSTGFIMQWGTLGNSNGTYNFPRAFPVGCFAVFVTNTNAQGTQVDNAFGYPVSNSQFFAATKSSGMANLVNNFPVAWLALGR
ncbi:hypothetical protein EOW31_11270 [Salmonella enterica]|nr:hypothetical protein [Salmonella enterica]